MGPCRSKTYAPPGARGPRDKHPAAGRPPMSADVAVHPIPPRYCTAMYSVWLPFTPPSENVSGALSFAGMLGTVTLNW